ncbi:MAG: hypothetical protein F4Y18_00395 [Cenarchaeum sp. SB0663_bin_5]|nr:hypothetical protein [Cenarchaeum sp. SB0663_bin_5]MYH04666.1 hypothetical protein [Cenarchaeum sp. SB0675_bin_21]
MKALTVGFESYDRQKCAESAALYVLQHFQPSLEKKTTPNHYVKKTMIDLMPDEQPDLDKIISSEIEFVVDKVRFNADWFTADDYLKLWKKYFTKFLDENMVIQESLQALRSNSDDTSEQFGLMMESLEQLQLMLKNSYDHWHRKLMAEFLESDLPLELYNLYNISYIGKASAIQSFVADLTRLRIKLHLVRSNERKITSELKEFERCHRGLSEMLMRVSRSESTLRFFLKTANAKELEDLFRTKPLALNSSTEEKRFKEYLGEFMQSLFKLTNHLDKIHLVDDIMLNSSDSVSFGDFDKELRQAVFKHA